MPDVNSSFQGQTLILPGAYYADNVQAATPNTPPPTPPLIFIGYGYGQKPLDTSHTYATPDDLTAAIRGGPCADFVSFLTSPSTQLQGAQLVTFINVGENTQSSAIVTNAGGEPVLSMVSADYGVPSNLLQYSVANGSTAGKKVTLFDGYSNAQIVGDNLGVPFQLAYLGAASGVTWSVAVSGLTALSFTVSSPNPGESYTIPIGPSQYETVEQIVEYLNGTGFYSAIVLGDGSLPATYLDAASGTLAKPTNGVASYSNVTAALGSVIYWVNQYASTLATATAASAVTGFVPTLAPGNVPMTSFTGARSIPPTNTDYANALNAALKIPGWAVFCDSNAPAVQALLAQHCITASSITYGRWRRGFTGSSVGDNITTTVQAAQALDAKEISYVFPGIWRTDTKSGVNRLYGGLYAAAAAAGMATGNPAAVPLTNKALVGNGVEVALDVTEINQLQQAGVMCIDIPTQSSVPTIVSDLTTWQIDNNPENVFDQQVRCRNYVAYSLVNAMRPYVGTTAASITMTQARNRIKKTLNQIVFAPGNSGVINSWDANSLKLVYTGDTQTLAISVNVTLVGQNRFITIYTNIQPLNITLTSQQLSAVA